jgi:hypothetical protein
MNNTLSSSKCVLVENDFIMLWVFVIGANGFLDFPNLC